MPGNFLQADVKVGDQRHLVFSTSEMLSLLAKSKQWYDINMFFKLIYIYIYIYFDIFLYIVTYIL